MARPKQAREEKVEASTSNAQTEEPTAQGSQGVETAPQTATPSSTLQQAIEGMKKRRRRRSSPDTEAVKIPDGMLEDFLQQIFDLVAQGAGEHWKLSEEESRRLHQATYYVLLQYGQWLAKHFVIVYAVSTLASICVPRIAKTIAISKEKSKTASP